MPPLVLIIAAIFLISIGASVGKLIAQSKKQDNKKKDYSRNRNLEREVHELRAELDEYKNNPNSHAGPGRHHRRRHKNNNGR